MTRTRILKTASEPVMARELVVPITGTAGKLETATAGKKSGNKKRKRIIDYLANRENGEACRSEIVAGTGIKWTTVYENLCKLELEGRVKNFIRKKGQGRPVTIWRILPVENTGNPGGALLVT